MKRAGWTIAGALVLLVLMIIVGGRAWRDAAAEGIPVDDPLCYAGTLLDANDGTPVDGTKAISVYFWDNGDATGTALCSTSSAATVVTSGRFRIPLSVSCLGVVHGTADLWAEVRVDGTSVGVSKLGAVPFAVEAEAATAAESANFLGSLAPSDVALSAHAHTGTYLPVGTSLSCSSGQKVTAMSASTGDLTCNAEEDPVFALSAAAGISSTDTDNWNAAFGWGDHGAAGYSTGAHTAVTAGDGLTGGGSGDVTLHVGSGSGITVTADTVAHADTSSQTSANNSGGTAIQDVTLDGFGHVTALGSTDLDARYYTETETQQQFLRTDGSQSFRILTGKVDFVAGSGYTETSDIVFSTPFTATPTLLVTQEISASCGTAYYGVRFPTTTKFRIWQSGATCNGAFQVHWAAIGY